MADPGWSFAAWSHKGETSRVPQSKYRCMPVEQITVLPVAALASRRSCLLFLWTTWPMLPAGMRVMSAWGFDYVTGGAWHKRTVNGKTAFGTGYVLRSACEPFLIGRRGRKRPTSRSERNLIEGLAREHSRKPEEAYRLAERLLPDARRVELFSRTVRPGWDHWGDQSGTWRVD